jgi:hypothetical protein
VKEHDVILASAVREFLLELEWQERDDLAMAIMDDLLLEVQLNSVPTQVRRREIGGYLVDYRSLTKTEAEQRNLKGGQILIRIAPITAGWALP